jgi:membrane protein required for colicin V production
MTFKSQLAALMTEWLTTPSLRELAAFAILFIATLIAGALLNGLLAQLVRATGLSGTDRLLGLVFGAIRGAIVVLAVIIILPKLIPVTKDSWWQQAQLIDDFQAFEAWGVSSFQQVLNWFKTLF